MILLDLVLGFLKVGAFTFGGGYSAIPLIRDVVLSYGWLSEDKLTYMIAVAESTPGPIMVNMATYVGSSQAGFPGAVLATLAVVLPSFVVIILVTGILRNFIKNPWVQAVLQGLTPCITAIILATGLHMTLRSCFPLAPGQLMEPRAVLIAAILFAAAGSYRKWKKKKLSPILLIVISALLGILLL